MAKYIYPILFIFLSCSTEETTNQSTSKIKNPVETNDVEKTISYKIVFTENEGWGYQIFEGSTMLINQIHIPVIQGIHSFSSKENATKTADYIMQEVKNGNFPPTLTQEILDSLDVL